jgi:hypothetical protein
VTYEEFIATKRAGAPAAGIEVSPDAIHPMLFPFQRACTVWALRRGKACLFQGCGMGKTLQFLEWARHVSHHTSGRVLILAPLAVGAQTVAEGKKMGLGVCQVRSQDEVERAPHPIVVTNYDMLQAFDAESFAGVILDEGSVLKNYTGATKRLILQRFRHTQWKLVATATPAPNDHLELGNYGEFITGMPSNEMIARWFVNNSMRAGDYRLKQHAEGDFWRWVASWAVCMSRPSDLGYSDEGFDLPELRLHQVTVEADPDRAYQVGRLFLEGNLSATQIWADKRLTAEVRCEAAAQLVRQDGADPWIVWCDTNHEADLLVRLLPDVVEVRGSESVPAKERKLSEFSDGKARVIITKPEIAGFGLNWQHCWQQVFVGASYSFEKTYQALRRSWRFRQTHPVDAWMISTDSERGVREALRAKDAEYQAMQRAMNAAMGDFGLQRQEDRVAKRYQPAHALVLPDWMERAA